MSHPDTPSALARWSFETGLDLERLRDGHSYTPVQVCEGCIVAALRTLEGRPTPTREQIAAALANARGMRRGVPPITNVLDLVPQEIKAELLDDADQVLEAIKPHRGEERLRKAVEQVIPSLESLHALFPAIKDSAVIARCVQLLRDALPGGRGDA